MRIIVGFFRIFVGILFIISGLIKLNDPVGFSFKLGDYFAAEVLNMEFLIPYALMIAVVVVVFEVLLGVMLIVGYAKKFTLWSLLLMIVFFTFLTFYSAYFNKVTDCGCFGDAMKLTPWESFTKDVVLLVMILVLYIGRKHIQPFFSKNMRSLIVFVTFGLCLWLGYHVLMHLPVVDFRAYKIESNIKEGMSVPDDAPPPIIEYLWEYEVNGKTEIISNTTGQDPKPTGGTRIGVDTKFLREPYEPPVHDFAIERDDEDYTETFLDEDNLIVVIAYNLDVTEHDGFGNVKLITDKALRKGYKVIGLSASSTEETEVLAKRHNLNFKFYFSDMTTLKTIVRSNPGILELQKGTIMQKLHFNDIQEFKLETLDGAMPNLNFDLKRQLDSVMELDQKYRNDIGDGSDWDKQIEIDSSNTVFMESVFAKHGYPGKSMVGEPTNMAGWMVIQHSKRIGENLDLIKDAGQKEEIPYNLVAMMEDRYLMYQGIEQNYGTQGRTITSNSGDRLDIIWPIKDPESVNDRRKEAGYSDSVEDYAKRLYGEDYVYKVYTLKDVETFKNQ